MAVYSIAKRKISRADAIAKGLKFYFTGRPCCRGHVSERLISRKCKMCVAKRTFTPEQIQRRRAYAKFWYEKNRTRLGKRRRKAALLFYRRNRKRQLGLKKTYYREHIEEIRARRSSPEIRARAVGYSTEWRRRNLSKVRVYRRQWRRRNRDFANEWRRKWWDQWKLKHPEVIRARRAARRTAKGRHTSDQIAAIMVRQRYICAGPMCRVDLRRNPYHLDHKTPISRGGTNWVRNLQWLCVTCNTSKGALTMREWIVRLKRA